MKSRRLRDLLRPDDIYPRPHSMQAQRVAESETAESVVVERKGRSGGGPLTNKKAGGGGVR